MEFKPILIFILLMGCLTATGQDYNPFKSIGRKAKILTLSKGKYVEFFDMDTVQRIGTVLFNIRQKKVVRLLNADSTFSKVSDNSAASRWYSIDPLVYLYFSYSPYSFTLNNPIKNFDPDGRLVIGSTKEDAKKFQNDLNQMLKDRAYDQLKALIGIKGKTFQSINEDAFAKATAGLNDDQKAFAQTVFNSINSKDEHIVEYVSKIGNLSKEASDLLNDKIGGAFTKTMENNEGRLSGGLIAGIWGATTVNTRSGTHSIIIEGLTPEEAGGDYLNSTTNTKGGNPVGRPGVAGHEVFGHGRYSAVGGEETAGHHVNAIRMENLILRVMGQGTIQRTGEDHTKKTKIQNPSALPVF
ncbi:hypothetical protein [Chitinophaga nivalis]|uniref:DUF4369 domain-containing protein n=1 Tax=Chitinophaga nivalis TaxID=2991709 RepID=A0ABT3INF6_9BACT|nr:hypothetical protein [Chitinophaga nivalis]MCW3464808.1 hypothetical protein [Chitinophaga nivalis]MCW3485501.1 hypothetical protein [Chitinophaga nivalis]